MEYSVGHLYLMTVLSTVVPAVNEKSLKSSDSLHKFLPIYFFIFLVCLFQVCFFFFLN